MSGTCGFSTTDFEPATGLRRLFGGKVQENAYREIQNLLAATPVRQLGPTAVADVLTIYKLSLSVAKPRLVQFYGMALRHFARDHELNQSELDDLRHLRNIFGLSDADVRSAASEAYRQTLKGATSDSHLSDTEKTRLATLESQLRLPDVLVQEIRTEEIGAVVQRAFEAVLADRRLSPAEERQLDALRNNLGVNITPDAATGAALEHFRLLWRLAQGELPALEAPIQLKRGEICHLFAEASHQELRSNGWKLLEDGTLYITNKRLLFDGSTKSVSIALSRIIKSEVVSGGLRIQKDSGKDQAFMLPQFAQLEVAGATLSAAMRGDRNLTRPDRSETIDLAEAPVPPEAESKDRS